MALPSARRRGASCALLLLLLSARQPAPTAGTLAAEELQVLHNTVLQMERRLAQAQAEQAASTRQALTKLQATLEAKLKDITQLVSQQSEGPGAAAAAEAARQCALSCAEGSDCLVVDYGGPGECRPLQRLKRCDAAGGAAAAGYYVSVTQTCARTCLQLLRQGTATRDGVYKVNGLDEPLFCDMTRDGGGWTLLLTAVGQEGWSLESLPLRNAGRPALDSDYSILRRADRIRDEGTGSTFLYRIEAQAEKGRGRWGGVWAAPRSYSFTSKLSNQTEIQLIKKFGNWEYGMESIQQRMPWVNAGGYADGKPLLTTTDRWRGGKFWGTLVTRPRQPAYRHSPWVFGTAGQHSGTVLYWIREEN